MSDQTKLATTEGAREVMPGGRADALLGQIIEAARDPSIDADKINSMARLAIDLQDRERLTQFNRDLALAMIEMPRITKNGRIVIKDKTTGHERQQGTYAKFEDLDAVVKPILARHNLVIRFEVGSDGPMTTCRPVLMHTNGHTDKGEAVKFPADTSGSKNATQAVGSAISYAKRHCESAALNLQFEGSDTDGRNDVVPSDPIIDWQARALEGAEIAAKEGKEPYEKWFETQQPRVRNWMVRSGNHARCGGAEVAIPPPKPDVSADDPPKDANPPSAAKAGNEDRPDANPPAPRTTTGGKKTPQQWADAVKRDITKCHNIDQLDIFLDARRDDLNRLNRADPDLWNEINNHALDRRAAIEEGRLV